jgi:predicted ATP-grasp superfamily ATP-dependent carboligase
MARVLVLDGQHGSALAVVRSLGRGGHICVVTAPKLPAIASVSRYCTAAHHLRLADDPGPLHGLVIQHDIDIVVPVSDVAMESVLEHFPEGRVAGATVAAPRPAAYRALCDKVLLLERAEALGIAVPKSVLVREPGQSMSEAAEAVGYPCVVKPHQSVVPAHGGRLQRLAVQFADTAAELGQIKASLPPEAYPVMVQTRITGRGEGVFLLSDGKASLASFAHKRLREFPPSGGASTYSESIAVAPELLELSSRLLSSAGWRGVAMVEFKRDNTTGVPYLMEVNGRFWGSLQLAVDAGVDFPCLMVDMLLDRPFNGAPEYRIGVRARRFWGDMDYLWLLLRRQEENQHLPAEEAGRGRWSILADVLRVSRHERIEELRWHDPMPFLFGFSDWVRSLGRRVSLKLSRGGTPDKRQSTHPARNSSET